VIEACSNLKLVCVAFTGIDHVDQERPRYHSS
jgi:lactate dehydrogenase-like 2-hydroxyacid dehydrogenase